MKTILDSSESTALFRTARDRMIAGLPTYDWPRETVFNWAVDWFDQVTPAERCALIVVQDGATRRATYGELRLASNRLANWLRAQGVAPGERVMVLMRNSFEYYALSLALMKLGAVIVPCFTSVPPAELTERMRHARIRHLAADEDLALSLADHEVPGLRLVANIPPERAPSGWLSLALADSCDSDLLEPWRGTPDAPLMGFFTSGTTSRPKLVLHSHQSYPIGHLSSLYWQGIGPSDCHANVSPPGWAKHAWSSFFVPFSAEATVLVFNHERPPLQDCLLALEVHGASSFCAPPSYWRSLVRQGLSRKPRSLTNVVSAGESLNGSVVDEVQRTWGLVVRDGYGQSEMTALIGFGPGEHSMPGALGHALPGSAVLKLVDPQTGAEGNEGEICIDLAQRPISLMLGYVDSTGEPRLPSGPYYRTGDLARRDASGCFHLLGRTNDVFKSYDLRISPIELERCFLEHPLVADIAVFAIRDEFGEPVPAAAVVAVTAEVEAALPSLLMQWQSERAAPAQQLRRLWLVEQLPRTPSGKIHRAQLRERFLQTTP